VERVLTDQSPSEQLFDRATKISTEGAQVRRDNSFKVDLLQRAVAKALRLLLQQKPNRGEP
jgi:CO/xanthine dehydrogenase FAD-binding subunit